VTFTIWLTRVGLPAVPSLNVKGCVPIAELAVVNAVAAVQPAVAVLVPLAEIGAAA